MTGWRDTFKVHPAADLFPMMADAELDALGADIKANGLKYPVVCAITCSAKGEIQSMALIDGRNRMEAAERAGVPLMLTQCQSQVRLVEIDDPVCLISSLNVQRRHLTQAQRADLIIRLAGDDVIEKPRHGGGVLKGGRGKKNPVKERALEINKALPESERVSERTLERAAAKSEGRQPQERTVTRPPLRLTPKLEQHVGIDAALRHYLDRCAEDGVDLDAQLAMILEAFKEITGKRMSGRPH